MPGLRPVFFNVVKMPECQVVVYRRAFRVSPEKVIRRDWSELVAELVGMQFIEAGEYTVSQVIPDHDYYDVIKAGEDAPRYRLHAASSIREE